MPLAGSLDIRDLLVGAPTVELDDSELRVSDVDILQVYYEVDAADLEGLVPPALNPTIPTVVGFVAYHADESPFGPFSLVQVRLSARAAIRPRAFLLSARCDNPALSDVLTRSWGFRIEPAEIRLRRFHDRVECGVVADRASILEVALVDPVPVTGHDIQYPPGMHLARVRNAEGTKPRIVQVDTEYEFRRADRGQPQLDRFEPAAWLADRVVPVQPVSASFTACDIAILPVHYVCNPDIPASEGTELVGSA
jgi:Acetoacetate decarboxylase (ADC)